jgi:hypothetical protein
MHLSLLGVVGKDRRNICRRIAMRRVCHTGLFAVTDEILQILYRAHFSARRQNPE